MNFHFHPQAEVELAEAVRYYEACQPSLGLEFAAEVYAAIRRVCKYPEAWSAMSANTRRCLVNRFPYGVIFQVKSGRLRIIAVANLHRHPDCGAESERNKTGSAARTGRADGGGPPA